MCYECKTKVMGWLPCSYVCKEDLLRLCFPELSLAEPNAAEAEVEVAESKAGVCCDKSVIAAFLLLPIPIGKPRRLCYYKNDFSSSGGFRDDTLPSNR